ncbi:MAG: hypothetical protein WD342_20145 [Verrucomicrobiales bacterium]
MKTAILVSFCIYIIASAACAGTRVLTFIYQPLTTLGTDQDSTVVIARVPILTNAVSEAIVAHIATPNRLVQDASAKIDDSNILSCLGAAISVQLQDGSHYSVTLDLTRLGDPQRFGVSARQVVESAVECVKRTIDETRLFHMPEQRVTWELHIQSRPEDEAAWEHYERRYEAAAPQ